MIEAFSFQPILLESTYTLIVTKKNFTSEKFPHSVVLVTQRLVVKKKDKNISTLSFSITLKMKKTNI